MVSGTRVSLDSVVHAFVSGSSAETIAQAFPMLNLEQVYGAITFYLAHREEVDRYLEARQRDFGVKRRRAVMAIRCSTRSWPTPSGRPTLNACPVPQDDRILVIYDQTTMRTHFGEFTRSKPVQDSSSFRRVSRSETRPTR